MKLYNPNKELIEALNLSPIWVQTCNSDTCSHASHDSGYEYCIIEAAEIDSIDIYNNSLNWEYSETLYRSKGIEFSVYSSSYAGTFDKSRLGREYFDLAKHEAAEDEANRDEEAEQRHQEEIEYLEAEQSITEKEGTIITLGNVPVHYKAWIKDGRVDALEITGINQIHADEIHPAILEGFRLDIFVAVENNL